MGKVESLEKISEEIKICKKCPLHINRLKTVPGDGDINCDIMFLGEAPGLLESQQGKPFVGRSGRLLNAWINKELGLRRKNVYMTNIVKCRPPNNRDPKPEEIRACRSFLDKQIKIVQPKVIITLGRIATICLLFNPDFKITKEHGVWGKYNGIDVMPIYHPSFLLRGMSEKKKKEVKGDFKKVLDFLNGDRKVKV